MRLVLQIAGGVAAGILIAVAIIYLGWLRPNQDKAAQSAAIQQEADNAALSRQYNLDGDAREGGRVAFLVDGNTEVGMIEKLEAGTVAKVIIKNPKQI